MENFDHLVVCIYAHFLRKSRSLYRTQAIGMENISLENIYIAHRDIVEKICIMNIQLIDKNEITEKLYAQLSFTNRINSCSTTSIRGKGEGKSGFQWIKVFTKLKKTISKVQHKNIQKIIQYLL